MENENIFENLAERHHPDIDYHIDHHVIGQSQNQQDTCRKENLIRKAALSILKIIVLRKVMPINIQAGIVVNQNILKVMLLVMM